METHGIAKILEASTDIGQTLAKNLELMIEANIFVPNGLET